MMAAAISTTWQTKAREMLRPDERAVYRRLSKRRAMSFQGLLAHSVGPELRTELARRAGA